MKGTPLQNDGNFVATYRIDFIAASRTPFSKTKTMLETRNADPKANWKGAPNIMACKIERLNPTFWWHRPRPNWKGNALGVFDVVVFQSYRFLFRLWFLVEVSHD